MNEEVRLDLAELKQSPPKPVQEAVKEAASDLNKYPSESYDDLKKDFADYLGAEENQVSFSNGLDEMIDLVTGIWGRTNFVPVPTFSQFAEASNRRNQEVVEVSMMDEGDYRIELDKIDFSSDIIWLCNPNNPTGSIISGGKIRSICRKSTGIVVVDECYAEFGNVSAIEIIDDFDNLIVLRSFSKSFGLAGLRLGAAISTQENIQEIEEIRQPFNVNKIAAEAGKAALKNREEYTRIREKVISLGEEFKKFLESRDIKTGEVNGNFLLAEFNDEEEAKRYYEGLQRLNVSVFPGWNEEFSGLGGNFLRFTIGTENQMNEVENRFKILEQNLQQEAN